MLKTSHFTRATINHILGGGDGGGTEALHCTTASGTEAAAAAAANGPTAARQSCLDRSKANFPASFQVLVFLDVDKTLTRSKYVFQETAQLVQLVQLPAWDQMTGSYQVKTNFSLRFRQSSE